MLFIKKLTRFATVWIGFHLGGTGVAKKVNEWLHGYGHSTADTKCSPPGFFFGLD